MSALKKLFFAPRLYETSAQRNMCNTRSGNVTLFQFRQFGKVAGQPIPEAYMDGILFDAFEHAQKSRLTDTDLRPEESTVHLTTRLPFALFCEPRFGLCACWVPSCESVLPSASRSWAET